MKENEELSLIEDAAEYVQELFRTNAGGHDADHTMRVYRNTLRIAENEPDCDVRIAALAALRDPVRIKIISYAYDHFSASHSSFIRSASTWHP